MRFKKQCSLISGIKLLSLKMWLRLRSQESKNCFQSYTNKERLKLPEVRKVRCIKKWVNRVKGFRMQKKMIQLIVDFLNAQNMECFYRFWGVNYVMMELKHHKIIRIFLKLLYVFWYGLHLIPRRHFYSVFLIIATYRYT